MKYDTFIESVNATLTHCCELLLSKGQEYNSEEDRLAAFKQAAALERTTPQRALFGMVSKHLVSLQNMCDTEIRDYTPEKWKEKIGDTINYMLLLKGLVDEEYEEGGKHGKH